MFDGVIMEPNRDYVHQQNLGPISGWECHSQEPTEYITPIYFEDGMDWGECELYYESISNGMAGPRSEIHAKRATKIRRPSKQELQQEARGALRSCLRTSISDKETPYRPLRRSISFDTIPRIDRTYSQLLCDSLDGTFSGPHVNFDDYVSVATITPFDEYPDDVQKSLWMSRDEANICLRDAMREEVVPRANIAAKAKRTEELAILVPRYSASLMEKEDSFCERNKARVKKSTLRTDAMVSLLDVDFVTSS
jgi:hypothetical protein